MWGNWISHILLMGMKNSTAPLENNLAVSYTTKHATTIQPKFTLGHLSQKNENLGSQKHAHECSQKLYFQ